MVDPEAPGFQVVPPDKVALDVLIMGTSAEE